MPGRLSVSSLTFGEVDQLLRKLQAVGFTPDMAREVMQRDTLTSQWVRDLHRRLDAPPPGRTDLFRTPDEIFDEFVGWSRTQGWPFDYARHFKRLLETMPRHISRLDSVLTLDIWLGDLHTTFDALWAWLGAVHGENAVALQGGLRSDNKYMRVYGLPRSDTPSVNWTVLDLTASSGKAVQDVRFARSAGLQVLTTAALHPEWPKAMDDDVVSSVSMGGLIARIGSQGEWIEVPHLGYHSGRLLVSPVQANVAYPHYSVPSIK